MEQIPGLKTLKDRTLFVGPDEKFPDGCRSCLLGSGLTAIRKTNKCNLQCRFCYNYGELDAIEPERGFGSLAGPSFMKMTLICCWKSIKNLQGLPMYI